MTVTPPQMKNLKVRDPKREWTDDEGQLTDLAMRKLWRMAATECLRKYKVRGLGLFFMAHRFALRRSPPREWPNGAQLVSVLKRY